MLEDNKSYQMFGSRNILLKIFDGCCRILVNVKNVLDLKRNFISICSLDDGGCVVKLDKCIKLITIMRGSMMYGFYVMDGENIM